MRLWEGKGSFSPGSIIVLVVILRAGVLGVGTEPSGGQDQPRRLWCCPERWAFRAAVLGEEMDTGLCWGFSEDQPRTFICSFQRNV